MGQFSQIATPQTNQPGGKGSAMSSGTQAATPPTGQMDGISRPMGKGGAVTYPGQGGQPAVGQPNNYSNTVGTWDNAPIGTQNPFQQNPLQTPAPKSGKGKGV